MNNKIQALKKEKKYDNIPIPLRLQFIEKVYSKKVTIKDAAKELGIKFSTSKVILQTYRREGRIGKKQTRSRKCNDGKLFENNKSTILSQQKSPKQSQLYQNIQIQPSIFLKNFPSNQGNQQMDKQNTFQKQSKSYEVLDQAFFNPMDSEVKKTNEIEQNPNNTMLKYILSQNFQNQTFLPPLPISLTQDLLKTQQFNLNLQTNYLQQEIQSFKQLNQNLLELIRQNQQQQSIRVPIYLQNTELSRSVNSFPDLTLMKPMDKLVSHSQNQNDPEQHQIKQYFDLKMGYGISSRQDLS